MDRPGPLRRLTRAAWWLADTAALAAVGALLALRRRLPSSDW